MQLLWRKAKNQSPAPSPIMISGYRMIQQPSLDVLILRVIWILMAMLLLSHAYISQKECPLHLLWHLTMMDHSTTQVGKAKASTILVVNLEQGCATCGPRATTRPAKPFSAALACSTA